MRRIADVGAAVIGTGFIGTVHVEATAADRRAGARSPGQHAGARRGARPGAGRRPRLSLARGRARRPVGRGGPRHVAEPPPRAAGTSDPRGRPACRVREAARRCRRPTRQSSSSSPPASGLVNAVNFNIRFYPLHQHVRELVASGGLGDVRLVTGHYLQDWLLLETDWNWRLEPDKGGSLRAVGDIGSHWLDLVTFLTGQRVDRRHGRPHDVHRAAPAAARARSRPFPRNAARTRSSAPMATEDAASILLRFEDGARGSCRRFADQPGPQELAALGDRRLEQRRGLGFRDTRPSVAGPSRTAERDPACAIRRSWARQGRTAAALPGGHVEGFADTFGALFRAIYADVVNGAPSARPPYATFAEGHDELLIGDAIAESARTAAGSTSTARPRPPSPARGDPHA